MIETLGCLPSHKTWLRMTPFRGPCLVFAAIFGRCGPFLAPAVRAVARRGYRAWLSSCSRLATPFSSYTSSPNSCMLNSSWQPHPTTTRPTLETKRLSSHLPAAHSPPAYILTLRLRVPATSCIKAEVNSGDSPSKATTSRSTMECLNRVPTSNTSNRVPMNRTAAFMATSSSRWASTIATTTTPMEEASR